MSDLRIPHLLKLIQEKKYDPKKLTTHERRMCVQYLRLETNLTQQKMAMALCVTLRCIEKDIAYLNTRAGLRFPADDIEAVFDFFYSEFKLLYERARAQGDTGLQTSLLMSFIDRLDKFGILKGAQAGDIIFGNKLVQNNNSQQLNVFEIAEKLNDTEKAKLKSALVLAGLIPEQAKGTNPA